MKHKYLFLAVTIIFSSLALAVLSVRGDSVTMDESPHIVSGYSYLTQKDMRLNPEHPPLIKDLSAVPLLFQNLTFDVNHPSWKDDVNGQWPAGAHFLYESSNNPDKIAFNARMAVLLIFIGLCLFVFWWGKQKYGYVGGLLVLFLTALSPNILAHARYVTTDAGAAFAFVFSIYFFVKYVSKPTLKNLALAGIAFGLAQLFKFSLFLLIPLYVFTLGTYYIARNYPLWKNIAKNKRLKFLRKNIWACAKSLLIIFVIGYLIIWPIYQFHVWNYPPERQARDTELTLNSFPIRPWPTRSFGWRINLS